MTGKRTHRTSEQAKAAHKAKDGVGYCRPPEAGQIKPGEVRNPKGRKKGERNLRTDLMEELFSIIEVRENGEKRRMTKQQALVKTLINDALAKGSKSQRLVFELMLKVFGTDEADPDAPLDKDEQAAMDLLMARFAQRGQP